MALRRAALVVLLCLSACCQAFYLPGVAPQDYAKVCGSYAAACLGRVTASVLFVLWQGDKLFLKVNKLSSTKTQLPYEYYSIPYCRPSKIVPNAENLGEVLRGDRIENSPYEVGIWCCRCCDCPNCVHQARMVAPTVVLPLDRDQSGPAVQVLM